MSPEAPEPVSPRDRLLAMITGYMRSQGVYAAAKLGLADLLVDGPRPVRDLAGACGAHAPTLHRLLRALASEGIFQETAAGTFALTPMAELLRSDVPGSMRVWALMFNEEQHQAWTGLLASVRTGNIAFDRVFGTSFFDYLAAHPESNQQFNRAMAASSERIGTELVDTYDFAPFEVVVDVGGGHGRLLRHILATYPQARGILFDQPHVTDDPATAETLRPVADRCEVVGGDFFKQVPAGGDVYVLKLIIHDWDDDRCTMILENCRRAMRPGGRLLIMESLVAPGNAPDFRKWMDLHMLALLGGRERTEAEFRQLLAAAGFELTRVLPLPVEHVVIEAVPVA